MLIILLRNNKNLGGTAVIPSLGIGEPFYFGKNVIAKTEDSQREVTHGGRLWQSPCHYERLQEEGDSHVGR